MGGSGLPPDEVLLRRLDKDNSLALRRGTTAAYVAKRALPSSEDVLTTLPCAGTGKDNGDVSRLLELT